jgi:hypothetical protein
MIVRKHILRQFTQAGGWQRAVMMTCALGLPGLASATCTVAFVQVSVDVGTVNYTELGAPGVSALGYRQVGQPRDGTLTVNCNPAIVSARFQFSGVVSAGNKLLRWDAGGKAGAMRLRITKATVGGNPVNMISSVQGTTPAPVVDVTEANEVVQLDLSKAGASASLIVLSVQATGFVPNGFLPNSNITFTATPRVTLQ